MRFPFALVFTYTSHVRSRNALQNIKKYMSSKCIIMKFGRLWERIFFEMCSRVSRLNFLLCLNTRESSFKALANVFEGLDFLSPNYCEQNKNARSETYQRHRHVNLSLDQSYTYFLRHITILK